MKILHIHGQYYPFGGAETYMRDLCKGQLQKDHEILIIYASDLPNGYVRDPFVHTFDTSWGIRTGINMKKKILPFIQRQAPDVIHMHVVHFAISPIVLKAICKRWPVVYTVHDILWLCMKNFHSLGLKHSARVLPNETLCDRRLGFNCIMQGCLPPIIRRKPWSCIKQASIALWRLNALKQVSKFIVNSEYVKKQLIDHSFREGDIRIVRPSLSVPEAWRSNHSKAPSEYDNSMILYVGKLAKHKGVYDLIDAVALIKNTNFKLIFIGDGEERNKLKSYARLRKVSNRVMIEGPLSRKELASYYRNASIVVLPSRGPESFGFVGLEAMYFGKPVVAYDVGAIREWLDNGHAGYVVRPGDVIELSHRIVDLLRDRHLQKEMGDCGRVIALPFTDKERFINEILGTYEDAIESFALDHQKGPTKDGSGQNVRT